MIGTVTNLLKKVFGDKYEKDIKELEPIVEQINEQYSTLHKLSNDELREKTRSFKQRIRDAVSGDEKSIEELKQTVKENPGMTIKEKEDIYKQVDDIEKKMDDKIEKVLEELLPEAFAVVRETARRLKENTSLALTATDFDKELAGKKDHITIDGEQAIWQNSWEAGGKTITWDMVHYDVQLMGGIALHQGKIAEMQTGEGKTLAATLPIYLNALAGKGVHLVTVNDYLSKRDAEWMGPLYEFHELSVDCIDRFQPNSEERRKAYAADITYGTNNEYGFDYLRDNMATNPDHLVQRKHHYTIVDEVDSVLIDDARTPLIISGPTSQKSNEEEFPKYKPRVEKLINAQKKLINELLAEAKEKLKNLNEKDADKKTIDEGSIALLRCHRGLPKNKALVKFLSEPGIQTQLQKTENFYLQDNAKEMPKVDQELYFVIEEKQNTIELTEKGIDLLSQEAEDPNFYIMPDIGSQIAEIDNSDRPEEEKSREKDELLQDYSTKAERIHMIDQLIKAYTLFEKDVDYVVMDSKVKIVDEQTGRVLEGRRYSDGLHQAIEAKEDVKIESSTQTYASITLQNYFRKYHKLAGMTGTAETEAGEFMDIYDLDVVVIPTHEKVIRNDKEDLVYKTQKEKYNAVIEEVQRMRDAGRPVLVGTTSVEVSELLSRMLKMQGIEHNVLNAKLHQKEADIIAQAGQAKTVTISTNMAGRGTDIKLGEGVAEAGGLAIIGTERHESRRVDRQLRGRSGRQGDPGTSQFFVSLEDKLMRIFGSERISKMMDSLGVEEGEVITHSMITKSIERAQKKVEENNFGIRKNLLKYDDVMSSQRDVIYTKRRHALFGDRLNLDIQNMFKETADAIVKEYHEALDHENFDLELIRVFSMKSPVTEKEFIDKSAEELGNIVYKEAYERYQQKSERLAAQALPVIENVHREQGTQYRNIVLPLSNGSQELEVLVDLKEAAEKGEPALRTGIEKSVTLSIIDNDWKDHLREMDDLRQSVQHARYEQKDPLLVYKFESFELFQKMLEKMNKEIVTFLMKASLPVSEEGVQEAQTEPSEAFSGLETSRTNDLTSGGTSGSEAPQQQEAKKEPVVAEKTPGRNEACYCGSGKKYKHCHGKGGKK